MAIIMILFQSSQSTNAKYQGNTPKNFSQHISLYGNIWMLHAFTRHSKIGTFEGSFKSNVAIGLSTNALSCMHELWNLYYRSIAIAT